MWGISRPPRRRESPRCFGDKGKRRTNTGYQPFTLSERKRLKMAFGLEPGKFCSMGSSWTSLRSRGGSCNTHNTGKEKARRPEGITQPSMAGTRPTLQEWNHPWV